MTPEEVEQKVMDFIDAETKDLSGDDYLEVLQLIAGNLDSRIEAIEAERK